MYSPGKCPLAPSDILSLRVWLLTEDMVLAPGPLVEVPDELNLLPRQGTKSTSFTTREKDGESGKTLYGKASRGLLKGNLPDGGLFM